MASNSSVDRDYDELVRQSDLRQLLWRLELMERSLLDHAARQTLFRADNRLDVDRLGSLLTKVLSKHHDLNLKFDTLSEQLTTIRMELPVAKPAAPAFSIADTDSSSDDETPLTGMNLRPSKRRAAAASSAAFPAAASPVATKRPRTRAPGPIIAPGSPAYSPTSPAYSPTREL